MLNQELITLLKNSLLELKTEGIGSVPVDESTWNCFCDHLRKSFSLPVSFNNNCNTGQNSHAQKQEPNSNDILSEPTLIQLPQGTKESQWKWLKNTVLNCPICKKNVKPSKKIVFGAGNLNADIFFCGEAPGAEEEIQGEPFVGKAGQLLTKIIQAMGLQRNNVYIGNIMNWRPEMPTHYGNRPPTQQEMQFCLPYLKAQIQVVNPKVIVALGATAVNGLLGVNKNRKMSQARGQWFTFQDKPLMVTFHPSFLLRNNTLKTKRLVWEDMLKVMEKVGLPISDKQKSFFL